METNPHVPRQRNRRADRQTVETQVVQPASSVRQPLKQERMQPQQYVQPQQFVPNQPPVQEPVYSQTPRTMYQQQPVNQSPSSSHLQSAPRPRTLNQSGTVNSGWQQPTLPSQLESSPAHASRILNKEAARENVKAGRNEERTTADPRKKLPGWLTTAMSLSFITVLALVAAYYLMQAYLVTEENKRIAAYEAVLDNYHVTEQPDGTLRVTWQEHIEKYAAQYNLQPAFVTAIIRNESSFRTNAESSVGARGLMQLMPDTAEWIAGKLNDNGYTFDSMWDAETNIRYGCWYLGYLSRLFHGDPVLISAAYHAGQTTVTQWLSDRTKSADGISLDPDKLSDGPTKQYIGRVTQIYGIYQTLLYPAEAFGAVPAGGNVGAAGSR